MVGVEMEDKGPQEGHLLAGVVEDDPGLVRRRTQAVWCHDHRQVVHVHLGHLHVLWSAELLCD